jgi:hypothetical protein
MPENHPEQSNKHGRQQHEHRSEEPERQPDAQHACEHEGYALAGYKRVSSAVQELPRGIQNAAPSSSFTGQSIRFVAETAAIPAQSAAFG